MISSVMSVNKVNIRLTKERLGHIIDNHPELKDKTSQILETVAKPDIILTGSRDDLLATKKIGRYWLVVVYKEMTAKDGFVMTAFITTRIGYLTKRRVVWKKP